MLAAVVLHDGQGWFFKVTGPPEAVQGHAAAFRKFIGSVHFVRSQPKWEVPSGWREEPGTAMRFATIRVPADDQAVGPDGGESAQRGRERRAIPVG